MRFSQITRELIIIASLWACFAHAKPQRIVSLDTATDTLVLRIADIEQIVAVRKRTKEPENSMAWDLARQVGGLGRDQAEAVYRLEPDIVFFGKWGGRSTREMMQRLGIPIERLNSPISWDEVYNNIEIVGDVTGHPDRAETMILEIQNRLDAIGTALEGVSPKRAIMYLGRGSTYGIGSRQHFIIESAGLINIAAEKGIQGIGKLDIEELILSEPDVIIFSDYHSDTPTLSRQILDHPAFDRLAGQVIVIDLPSNRMNGTCSYLVDCVDILAQGVYPQRFQSGIAHVTNPSDKEPK